MSGAARSLPSTSAASSSLSASAPASVPSDPSGFLRSPAFGEATFALSSPSDGSDRALYEAQAWQRATGQAAGVAQTAFTLYMFVGNQLALFNLIFLFTFGAQPVANLLATGRTFAPMSVPGANLLLSKLVYVALNVVGLLVVLWKVRAMGLLPLTSADWVSLLPARVSTHWGAAPEL